jgi:hypothetical protein
MNDKSDQCVDAGENVKELAQSELEGERVGDFELNFGLLLKEKGKESDFRCVGGNDEPTLGTKRSMNTRLSFALSEL